MTLTLLGLGPGHIDDLSRRAWAALEQARTIIVRTAQHPCVPLLPHSASILACDDLYERHADFQDVYAAIVARVIDHAQRGDVVYAVPGDPLVAEATVQGLFTAAAAQGIPVTVVSGISFIEPALALVRADAIDGLQLHDAIAIANAHHPPLNPDYPALLGQVYSRDVASNLKLTLMNQYPDTFEVLLIHAAGMPDAMTERVPLHAIDHSPHIRHLTALYVPAYGALGGFEALQETIAHLRAPEGCPWDREQTHLTLRKYLLEEAYEVLEALDAENVDALREELGDLLLQIVLHAQIAVEDGEFTMRDVIAGLNAKLIRRHPHVWGDVNVGGAADVVTNWEALKKQEHAEKGIERRSILDSVPKGLPALAQAYEYTAKAAKPGFDWAKIDDVAAKAREELAELLDAERHADHDPDHVREELGDLLFVLVNWSRWLKIDPEIALREANAKFYRRFHFIETQAAAQGRALNTMSLAEMDALWNQAKAEGL
ncbi:MAG: nucleoside triphosphate pyrophosphohydrolase [bacterium]|nr:nucleoside triphosphate pyrophosphohydrolase [bacterium]